MQKWLKRGKWDKIWMGLKADNDWRVRRKSGWRVLFGQELTASDSIWQLSFQGNPSQPPRRLLGFSAVPSEPHLGFRSFDRWPRSDPLRTPGPPNSWEIQIHSWIYRSKSIQVLMLRGDNRNTSFDVHNRELGFEARATAVWCGLRGDPAPQPVTRLVPQPHCWGTNTNLNTLRNTT